MEFLRKSGLHVNVVLLLLTTLAGLAAFYRMFSRFSWYDDEGTLMIQLQQFIEGHVLYDEIFSEYGPFPYLTRWLLLELAGLPLSHDFVRMTAVAAWLGSAILCAYFIYEITGSPGLTALGHLLGVVSLSVITNEPGHPSELCGLMLSITLLLSLHIAKNRWVMANVIGMGFLTAATVMTKPNIGVFLVLSAALTYFFHVARSRKWQWITSLTVVLALILPVILMRARLGTVSGLSYCLIVTFSIGALTLWAFDGNRTGITWSRHIKWWLLSAIAISVVILWASLASGTSLAGLVDGFVLKSLAFSQEVYSPAALDSRSVTWAFLSTALAVAYFAQHTFGSSRASFNMFVEAFKTLFGIGVIVFASVPGTLLWFGTPLLWLLVVSRPDAPKDVQATLPRLFLAFLALLQSLHAFPLAGSQLGYSTFLLIPAGLICLHDVVRVRLGLGNERKRIPSFSLVLSGLMLFGVVAAYTFWAGLGYRDYHSKFRIDAVGAELIRVPEAQAAFFGWCTENLKRHSDTFISGPGLNSVYFWTEQSPPTASNAGTWMTLFDDERQRQIVRSLANYPKACVLYNRERAKFWTERLVPPKDVFSSPLNRYIKENFEEVGRVQDFQFMVRKDRAKPELTFFASWKQWVGGKEESETTGGSDEASESQGGRNAVLLRLPTRPDWQVHRIVIAGGQTFVADTHPAAGTAKVAVFDEEGQRIELPFLPVSDSAGLRRVWLVPVEPLDRSAPRELFVRLLGPRDEWIASIPFED